MSDQGQPQAEEVIDFTLSSDSDDNDFFTAPMPVFKRQKPSEGPPPRSPTPPLYDSEDEDAPKKRKRPLVKKKPKSDLPEWTRRGADEKERRAEREKRKASRSRSSASATVEPAVVELSSDEDPVSSTKLKGKGKAVETPRRTRRDSPELTPPPIQPEFKAKLRRDIGKLMDDTAEEDVRNAEADYESQAAAKRSQPTADGGPRIRIWVRMVADEEKKATASEKAVAHYEQKREFTMGIDWTLDDLAQTVADRIGRPAADLVLVHNNRRLYDLSSTPRELHFHDGVELTGYEKAVWDKASKKAAAERARELAGDDAAPPEPSSPEPPSDKAEEPEDAEEKVVIKLRGAAGELPLQTVMTKKVITVLRFYCQKRNLPDADPSKMYLSFDGERFSGDMTLADMDVTDQDLVDVGGV